MWQVPVVIMAFPLVTTFKTPLVTASAVKAAVPRQGQSYAGRSDGDTTKTCSYCRAIYELPPDYISGENLAFQTVHPKDRETRQPTGQVIIIVANVRVHECWRDVAAGPLGPYLGGSSDPQNCKARRINVPLAYGVWPLSTSSA